MKNNLSILLTAYETYGSVSMDEFIEMFIDEELEIDGDNMLSDYNEYLSEKNYYDDCIYSMNDFDEIMSGYEPWEIARSCFYGDFKPCDDYFRFNGYGNLESLDSWEVEKEIKEDRDFLRWYIEKNDLIDEDEAEEIINEANELIEKGW